MPEVKMQQLSKEDAIKTASDRSTGVMTLDELSRHQDRDVREAVAGNTSAAISPTIDRLRWDTDPKVRAAAERTTQEKVKAWLREYDERRKAETVQQP